MTALVITILFLLLGLAVLSASFFLTKEMKEAEAHLFEDADHEKGKDHSASIAMMIEGKMLEHIPSYVIYMVTGIIGATLIAFGFVALAFYFH